MLWRQRHYRIAPNGAWKAVHILNVCLLLCFQLDCCDSFGMGKHCISTIAALQSSSVRRYTAVTRRMAMQGDLGEMFARMRQRSSSWAAHSTEVSILESGHPAVLALDDGHYKAVGITPTFSTRVESVSADFATIFLLWDATQDADSPGESDLVKVGALSLALRSGEDCAQDIENELCVRIGELKNVDILPQFRGVGGGEILIKKMLAVLRSHGHTVVILSHLDKGTGKLINWYKKMGFRGAQAALPSPEERTSVMSRYAKRPVVEGTIQDCLTQIRLQKKQESSTSATQGHFMGVTPNHMLAAIPDIEAALS